VSSTTTRSLTFRVPTWAVDRLEAEAKAAGRSRHAVGSVLLLAAVAELPEPTCTPEA
jgi:hypothetical protein